MAIICRLFFFSCGNFVGPFFLSFFGIGNGKCDVLLAHDWGAGIGWELVIRHPELVRRFVPMNCPHPAAFVDIISTEYSQILKSWLVQSNSPYPIFSTQRWHSIFVLVV